MDLSTLSNEDLMRALAGAPKSGSAPSAPEVAPPSDLQGLSDDDLMAALKTTAPDLDAGRVAGLGARAGVQAAPGMIAGLPALAYDGTVGFLQNMGTQLVNVKRRAFGEEEAPYRDPFQTTNAVSGLGTAAADALNLPKPETPGERVAVGALQTGAEALGGARLAARAAQALPDAVPAVRGVLSELAEAPKTQAFVGSLAGGGAQTAVENDVNPLIGMGAGLALGVTGSAVPVMARQGFQRGQQALDNALVRTPDVQEQIAAQRVRGAASDPDAALRELNEGAAGELVPGSRPTTFQATGDVGLGSLERELQTANPGAFAERRGAQNSARLESMRSVQGEGNAGEIVTFLRGQLDEIDRATAGDEDAARSAARGATEAFEATDDAAGLGARLRGGMDAAEQAARARESALWNAVDPDGNLTATTGATKQAASRVYQNMTKAAESGLSADERRFAEIISGYGDSVPLRELIDLRSEVEAAKRTEMRTAGRSRAHARLTQLSGAVRSGIENSAAAILESDPAAKGRFQALFDEWQSSSDLGAGANTGQARAVQQGGFSGAPAEEAAPNGRAGFNAGASGRASQAKRKPGLSLTQYIARNGGLPLDAESTARDWGNVTVKGYGKLARPNGRSVDGYWRNKLIDAGYLPKDADGYSSRDITKELFDAIENERAGRKTLTADDEMQRGFSEMDDEAASLESAAKQIREELQAVGVPPQDLSSRALSEAAELLSRGDETDAVTAYERAVMSLDDEDVPVRASTPQAEPQPSSNRNIFDTFREDPEAGKRYGAATTATRERAGTFGRGYAGDILRKGETRDSFRVQDASVLSRAFHPGPTGGDRIKSIVAAGGSKSDLAEMAASSLSKHIKDGVLDPKGYQRWRQQYDAALRELPEDVRARFANASLASQALERATATRKAKLADYNKSVLGRLANINVDDLPKEIGAVMNGRDAAAKMNRLVQASRGDQAARDGLKRAVAEWIEGNFISNKEVGVSGENGIKANAFASLVKDKAPALRQVFSGPEYVQLLAIADDIKRAERSLQAVRVPGNSNTAADVGPALERAARDAGKSSLFMQILAAAGGGALVGDLTGAAVGAAGAGLKHVAGGMRAAGLKRVDDLVLEMMLNPDLAKVALSKAPLSSRGAQQALVDRLLKLSPFAVAGGSSSDAQ